MYGKITFSEKDNFFSIYKGRMELTNPTNSKLVISTTGNLHRKIFLVRTEKGRNVQLHVNVPCSRRRYHRDHRSHHRPVRGASRKASFENSVSPRRRKRNHLSEAGCLQRGDPDGLLRERRGDRPHEVRGEAL